MTLLAVTGLNREAQIVGGPGIITVCSGGDPSTLPNRIDAALIPEVMGIISIGIAGALDASLEVGDMVIATDIVFAGASRPSDGPWRDRLRALAPRARAGLIAGSNTMLVSAAAKASLFDQTGALCVDMESHIAAELARRRGLPMAAVRFISDGATRALPRAAQVGMSPGGGVDLWAVLRSLGADPAQLPALIRTGFEAQKGFSALLRGRNGLGASLGFADI